MPFRPADELMLTRLPPRSTRCGIAAAQVFHVPIRLTSNTVRHCFCVVWSQVPTVSTPALATDASNPPSCATPSSTAAANASASRTSTHMGDHPAAVLFGQPSRFGQILTCCKRVLQLRQRLADVDQDEVGALLGKPHRVAAAHPPCRPGDQDPLAGDPSAHRVIAASSPLALATEGNAASPFDNLSVVAAKLLTCRVTDCFLRLSRRRFWRSIVVTLGMCGISPSSSNCTGNSVVAHPATTSSALS